MSLPIMGNQQKKEIETIREKNIKVKLSEADCERISNLCGEHNITVANLIENFVGDLVNGTYSNGSDERVFAKRYFERCWFGMYPEKTLLNYLLSDWDVDSDDFMDLLEQIEETRNILEDYEKNPTAYDKEEIEYARDDLVGFENELEEIKRDFIKANEKADWEKEIESVKKWFEEKTALR